jgi:hypothetical protein
MVFLCIVTLALALMVSIIRSIVEIAAFLSCAALSDPSVLVTLCDEWIFGNLS